MLRSEFLAGAGATTVAAGYVIPSLAPSISIAVCAPFSGSGKNIGDRLAKGVNGAINEANQLAGQLQRTYAMRTFDDQNNIATALLVSNYAINDNSVIGVIGHVSSDCTIQSLRNYGPAQMPLVVPFSTDDRVTATQYHNVFRLPTKDSTEGRLWAQNVIGMFKPKLPYAYVFVQDADYGADVANGFIGEMTARKAPTQYQQFPYANADFGAVVDKALTTPPDYVFLAGAVGDMGPIVGTLRAKGYTGPIGASQGFFDPGTFALGPAADGMTVSTSMPYLPLAPSTVQLVNDFRVHFGGMDPFAAFGYAAAQLLISAVTRTNAGGRSATVTAIAQGVPTDTMTGQYSFNAFGDALQPEIYFYTAKGGKFTYLKQAQPSTFMMK